MNAYQQAVIRNEEARRRERMDEEHNEEQAGGHPMSALSNEEKNRRIAEACGWTDIREQDYCEAHINPYEGPVLQYWEGVSPNGEKGPLHDYTGDLNAIAGAEAHAIEKQSSPYAKRELEDMLDIRLGQLLHLKHPTFRATAEQRANALGITLGLWKEGE